MDFVAFQGDEYKAGVSGRGNVVVAPILQLSLFRESVTDLICIALHGMFNYVKLYEKHGW